MSYNCFVERQRPYNAMRELCQVLCVAPSAYYAWWQQRQHGLWAQQPRSFVPRITDLGHGQRVASNRLRGEPRPTQPDRVWVGDIT